MNNYLVNTKSTYLFVSKMSVVNCKVEYLRQEGYDNLKEWCNDAKNAYVGRAGIVFVKDGEKKERFPKQSSVFCNPFKVGKDGTRDDVIQKYKSYIISRLESEPAVRAEFQTLKGKRLGCWCKPEACHADILVELMNQY